MDMQIEPATTPVSERIASISPQRWDAEFRLIEMQLTAEHSPPPGDWPDEQQQQDAQPKGAAMREYEARRCHICGCKYPPFGFGPPLTRGDQTLWACRDHRDDVDRLVSGLQPRPAEGHQPTLFDHAAE